MGNLNTPEAGDDIGELARHYLDEPGTRGIERVEAQIAAAKGDSRWDDMGKWHRVRFRLMRMQQERAIGERMDAASESRATG